jgi:membrane protein YqaA with SNARE-associated domain
MEAAIHSILAWFSIPSVGLPAVGLIAFISATLLPMGSEPVVFAYIKMVPHMFWAAILVATLGNTLGGMVSWAMGRAARLARHKFNPTSKDQKEMITHWFERFGPKTLLLSWLPFIGDPICALAGWAKLPWKPCLIYMAIGKLCRYITMTLFLLWIPDSFWAGSWRYISHFFGL